MNTCSSIFGKRRNYVKYGDSALINYGDFHTHTTYSLHGMSSPSEMVDAAIEAGLDYIALTDHHYVWPNTYPYVDGVRNGIFSLFKRIKRLVTGSASVGAW